MAEARAMDGLLHTIKNVALQTDDCTVPATRYPGPHPARALALVSVCLPHLVCVCPNQLEFGESDRRRPRHTRVSHDPFTGCPAPPLSLPHTRTTRIAPAISCVDLHGVGRGEGQMRVGQWELYCMTARFIPSIFDPCHQC
jgi:hypothetical protein